MGLDGCGGDVTPTRGSGPRDETMKQMSRIAKALRNPLFVLDTFIERVVGDLSTLWFRVNCALRGVRVGRAANIFGRCIIRRGIDSRIELGHNLVIVASSWRSSTGNCFRSKLR